MRKISGARQSDIEKKDNFVLHRIYFAGKKHEVDHGTLTIVGNVMNTNGIFRPKWFVMIPKTMFPMNPPTLERLAIHDPSSIVMAPDGKGDSFSELRTKSAELVHPAVTP